ncbi:MAG: hypothetical protein KAS17_09465, partial [Victivallaceae bacterium]|nr:hypothetical protein [Victivallaceae bacterium]
MKANKQYGYTLLAAVMIIMGVSLVSSLAMLNWSRKGYKYAIKKTNYSKLFYAADSGVRYAAEKIMDMPSVGSFHEKAKEMSNDFLIIAASLFPSAKFTFERYTVDEVSTNLITHTSDGAEESYELENAYEIRCRVSEPGNPDNYAELSTVVGRFSVSPLDYSIYYQEEELEMYPDWVEIKVKGKVHSNNGIHLGPLRSMRFLDYITCADDVYQGASAGKGIGWEDRDGNIYIANEDDTYVDMRTNYFYNVITNTDTGEITVEVEAQYLDGNDPNWEDESNDKWDKKVKTKGHGVANIKPSFDNSTDEVSDDITTILIDPDPRTNEPYFITSHRFENLAGFVLTAEGNLYEQTGPITNAEFTIRVLIDNVTNLNWVVTTNQFFNRRNMGYWTNDVSLGMVYPTDIDIGLFNDWLLLQPESMSFKHHASERAGIFYIQLSNDFDLAVRINNAEELYDLPRGLTLSTLNPIYMRGDFNIKVNGNENTNHAALIISDAINVLSASWDDRENNPWPIEILDPDSGDNPEYYAQDPCDTTWNCSILSGSPVSLEGEFQATGGAQNFIRFLEYWRSHAFDMNGSIGCLWKSRIQGNT